VANACNPTTWKAKIGKIMVLGQTLFQPKESETPFQTIVGHGGASLHKSPEQTMNRRNILQHNKGYL
jgi:hypothetical protein